MFHIVIPGPHTAREDEKKTDGECPCYRRPVTEQHVINCLC